MASLQLLRVYFGGVNDIMTSVSIPVSILLVFLSFSVCSSSASPHAQAPPPPHLPTPACLHDLDSSAVLVYFSSCIWKIFMFTLNLVIIIRLQVPRLALRRRLSALKGGVSRPAAWRHRPISFLCYILSVSTLRPLACRVRSLWLVEVQGGQQPYSYILLHLLSCLLWSISDQSTSWCSDATFPVCILKMKAWNNQKQKHKQNTLLITDNKLIDLSHRLDSITLKNCWTSKL